MTQAMEVPYTAAVALNEALGDRYRDGEGGMPTPYFQAQQTGQTGVYWGLALGVGPAMSYLAANGVNNALHDQPFFNHVDGTDLARHVISNVALEDGLYWAMRGKPVNDTWMRGVAGNTVGQTLGENAPLGVPASYAWALGAGVSGPVARYRSENAGQQDFLGGGGKNAVMNGIDAAVRVSSLGTMLITSLPVFTGNPLPAGMRSVGTVMLTGSATDGWAALQDGLHRGSWAGTVAGAAGIAASFFQMSTLSAYAGTNAQGLPSAVNPRSVSVIGLAFGVLSVGAKVIDQSTGKEP